MNYITHMLSRKLTLGEDTVTLDNKQKEKEKFF